MAYNILIHTDAIQKRRTLPHFHPDAQLVNDGLLVEDESGSRRRMLGGSDCASGISCSALIGLLAKSKYRYPHENHELPL